MKGLTRKSYGIFKTYHINEPYWPNYTIYAINLLVLYITWSTGREGWLRLFGSWYGIQWNHKDNELLFSELYGYIKSVTLFNYRWKILNPAFKTKK